MNFRCLTRFVIIGSFCLIGGVVTAASPTITSYTLNGQSQAVTFNAADGKDHPLLISLVTDQPVKLSTLSICLVSDTACSRTSGLKYFTSTDLQTVINKSWDGKTGGSNPTVVADGSYKLKATVKNEAGEQSETELATYVITVHSETVTIPDPNATTTDDSENGTTTENSNQNLVSGGGGVLSAHSSETTLSTVEATGPKIGAGRNRLAVVGQPLEFQALRNGTVAASYYTWSFGDGTSAQGEILEHVYRFPGDYQVVLNAGFSQGLAVSRTAVKIIDPIIKIADISPIRGYVALANEGTNEINLGGWILQNASSSFILPPDTIITPQSPLKLPTAVLPSSLLATGSLSLSTPDSSLVHRYALNNSLISVSSISSTTLADLNQKLITVRQKFSALRRNTVTSSLEMEEVTNLTPSPTVKVVSILDKVPTTTPIRGRINTDQNSTSSIQNLAGVIVLDDKPLKKEEEWLATGLKKLFHWGK